MPEINDVIRQSLPVNATYVPVAKAHKTTGLLRSLSVTPPPTPDGRYRIIEIGDLDRQACGGTHLTNTGHSRQIRIVKIENKGWRLMKQDAVPGAIVEPAIRVFVVVSR